MVFHQSHQRWVMRSVGSSKFVTLTLADTDSYLQASVNNRFIWAPACPVNLFRKLHASACGNDRKLVIDQLWPQDSPVPTSSVGLRSNIPTIFISLYCREFRYKSFHNTLKLRSHTNDRLLALKTTC